MKKIFFVVAAIIIGSQLIAQDTAAKSLDEVVLIANKYPNKASLTGKVVTVITRQKLEQSGGKDLSQILTEQTGLYINGANSNAGKDKSVFLRGAKVDHTLITIDGVPVYDASGIGGNFDVRNMAIDNIERVEILKGSQSTLYGSDAIAGVINIITRKPSANKIKTHGVLSYGSNNTFRGNAGISGRSNKVDYQLGYTFYDTRGINETVDKGTFPVTDKDGYQQNNVQAKLGIQPNKNISIQSFIRYNKIKGDIDQGAFTDELDYTFAQKSLQAGIRNEFDLNKTKLTVLYNYNHISRLYIDDSVKSRNGFDTYSRGSYEANEHLIDAYMVTSLSKIAKLTAGADIRLSSTDQLYIAIPAWAPPSSLNADMNQQSIYGSVNVNTNAGFNIEAGGRINFHSEYGSYFVYNINPSYLLNKKVKLFANLSSGYRTPSLYQLYSEYGNKDLQPESAFTAEAGVQYFSKDDKWNGRITGFARNVKDGIGFISKYINQDKQRDYGAELELSFKPTSKISIKAFYSYVDGKIITKKNGKDTTYFNLIRRPKNSFGVNLAVQATDQLYISSNLSSFGERKDSYFDSQTFTTANLTLDNYFLWDIYAEYSFCKKRLKVFADLRNITNSKYNESAGFNTLDFNAYGGIRFNF